jgi:membrane protein required for colicin V production
MRIRPMTGFDVIVLAVLFLSTLLAFVRGVVRELISIAAWIVGFVAAITYAGVVAEMLSGFAVTPLVRHVIAFALILLVVLIAGGFLAWMLRSAVHAIGLGFVDRFLGGLFGLARGVLAMVAFALIAGLTTMPKQDWWQNSLLGAPLAEAALALRPYLPAEWAQRLDYSPAGTPPRAGATTAAWTPNGEALPCVES